MDNKLINIPNVLTIFRFILAPLVMYFILIDRKYIATGLFVIAIIFDGLDGFLARRYGWGTDFGRIADPLADKILFAFALYGMLIKEMFVGWMIFFGLWIIAFSISYSIFIKKKINKTQLGRFSLALQALLFVIMLMGYVNNLTLIIFTGLLLIPIINYIPKFKKGEKNE